MEIKLNPGKHLNKMFEKFIEIENERNSSNRRLGKEVLIYISAITATATHEPSKVTKMRSRGDAASIEILKPVMT